MTDVPPVAPSVPADVLDALPPRLRRRVDASTRRAADWTVTRDGDTARAELDEDTALVWTLCGGVLATADDLTCGCLLAPRCLHRGIAVAAAEIAEIAVDAGSAADPTESVGTAAPSGPAVPGAKGAPRIPPTQGPPTPTSRAGAPGSETDQPTSAAAPRLGEQERAAVAAVWSAGAAVLRAGATGSGTVIRAELLRAVHGARLAGLHRIAATGLRIATALAAARAGDSVFERTRLTADLLDLLLVCHDLRSETGDGAMSELRGTARRDYRPVGTLRLFGLCTEAVVAASGYAGVVTHLVEADGVLWTVPAILPGGVERVVAAAGGPVAIGESGLSQRELGRAGLLLSGGTASPDHRLGAGRAVRAVASAGAAWTEAPLAGLWDRPVSEQTARAFHATTRPETHRPAGADLLFLDCVTLGAAGGALRVSVADPDGPAAQVDLVGEGDRARENLRVLSASAGLRLRVVARLLPDRAGTATALAVHGAPGELTLPAAYAHHVDLGLDRLQSSHVTTGRAVRLPPRHAGDDRTPRPIHALETLLHRVTLGGRPVGAVASADRAAAALRRTGLGTAATLLTALAHASRDRQRDAFGRVVREDGDEFPLAWLRAAVYVRDFGRAAARQAWSRVPDQY
ncbi:hypothetical protein FHR81_002115 [Actinoalloteichus hoggarensis]|uniref:Uncharacterized protein n=1 Tax=Actinoalloteichus hoggarensis TaxID=1470176 RepID=A0A221W5M9_9PSEU|nr:hypothetical protein [Actinoalloteichus hoggarensis]ASO21148.1 hypothetical protein AHOG_17615 [Actinoalloteichus hoggarensis]MBB5921077.1 hypothetical protein [Actinoalloteichus hoggarensis]